jgi:hypothetical protein
LKVFRENSTASAGYHPLVAGYYAASVAAGRQNHSFDLRGDEMASEKQTAAARKNIKKAATAARSKRTIAHLPKKTRTALGKQGAKVRKENASS